MENQLIQDLQDQINKLRSEVNDLTGNFYKNNFSSEQIFTKSCDFSTGLKVPNGLSTKARVGEIAESGGVLYICTAAPSTWEVVGLQS